jgi:hypothetical protein
MHDSRGRAGATRGEQAGFGSGEGEPAKEPMPPVAWAKLLRRTFALDVFACVVCGGRRQLLAYMTVPSSAIPCPPMIQLSPRV